MAAARFKRGMVTVLLGQGPVGVSATLFRSMAIHKTLDGFDDWVVTHVPTGLAIAGPIRTQRIARRLVLAIVRHVSEFADVANDVQANQLSEKARSRIYKLRRATQLL